MCLADQLGRAALSGVLTDMARSSTSNLKYMSHYNKADSCLAKFQQGFEAIACLQGMSQRCVMLHFLRDTSHICRIGISTSCACDVQCSIMYGYIHSDCFISIIRPQTDSTNCSAVYPTKLKVLHFPGGSNQFN